MKADFIVRLILTVIVLGGWNHCILEDAMALAGKALIGLEAPAHLPNHPGASTEHQHDGHPDTHRHGQPHSTALVPAAKNLLSLSQLSSLSLYVRPLLVATIPLAYSDLTVASIPYVQQPDRSSNCTVSMLIAAPQAPPTA